MDKVNEQSEWLAFIQEKGMMNLEPWEVKVTPEDFSYPYKNHALARFVRQGVLQRQGKIFSSNWKKAHFVLTEGCFLHCFDSADAINPKGKSLPAEPVFSVDFRDSMVCFSSFTCSFQHRLRVFR